VRLNNEARADETSMIPFGAYSSECVEVEFSEVAPHIPRPMEQLSANLAASATRSTILLRRPWSVLPILPRPGPMKLTTRR